MLNAPSSESLIALLPILLPVLLGTAGWGTIKLVRFLAIHPQRFIGIKPYLGWQGYFFTNKNRYIDLWSRGVLEKLGGLQQIFELIGPEKVVTHQLNYLRPQIDGILDQIMSEKNAVLWENLPILIKNRFYARAHRLLPRIIDDIVEELGDGLPRILTYEHLLNFAEKQQPGTLLKLYNILSRKTFNSMGRFCAWMGFILGCIQLVIVTLTGADSLWFYVLWSAFSVFFFFWVCQHWIEYPYKPITLGRWKIRSPYAKFRLAQDQELASLLAGTVLSPRNLFGTLLYEGNTRHTHTIIKKQLSVLVEDVNIRTFVQLTLGPIGYVELKSALTDKLTNAIITPLLDEQFNNQRSQIIAVFIRDRLNTISDSTFYTALKNILTPLAIVAGIGGFWIGAAAGFLQWLLLYF
ncbi:hypothetical protein FT643_02635 [Ketobacter sp. MCCC 1A13808]|uniref:hypothetical protein n=1 Tax=Ketobacter sp. MCCC 1A13808 TaxID=2602738 RepID=UPI000F2AE54A|nr:hypothetical protein [Ketobacter sp. MCCC 1A13808]MVF11031.1 hypothetical protein [Ketobacter sp. MCCC 1A13808]RLP56415.1 MAG: hypothetical protein D6160_03230 [Ketobacter sp.]